MKLSQAGVELIKRFEGLRLTAYLDAVGIPTIGYGSTEGVPMGQKITESEAEALLRKDLVRFEKAVNDHVKVKISQNQYDAMVSLAFNIGASAFAKSTLVRVLNEGGYAEAADQFLRWDKARGKTLPGLATRRQAERKLFLTKDAAAEMIVDLPMLRAPWKDTAATRILRVLLQVPDGDLTPAIKQAQTGFGIAADGIVGPDTWRALLATRNQNA